GAAAAQFGMIGGMMGMGGGMMMGGQGGNLGVGGNLGALGALGGVLGGGALGQQGGNLDLQQAVRAETEKLRQQAEDNYSKKNSAEGSRLTNDAAALEQANEILVLEKEDLTARRTRATALAGQSVTHHLKTRLSVPSRNEE